MIQKPEQETAVEELDISPEEKTAALEACAERAKRKASVTKEIPSMIQKRAETSTRGMSPAEAEYLEDIKGLIDYVVRNRLPFRNVLAALSQDALILAAHDQNLGLVQSLGLGLQVAGARRMTPDNFGMSEDDE